MPSRLRTALAALLITPLMAVFTPAHAADDSIFPTTLQSGTCAIGAGLGATLNTSRIESGVRIDSNGSGGIIAPDVTCSVKIGTLSYGVMGRYTVKDVTASIMGLDLKSHSAYTAAARIGYDLNAGAHAYGLIGLQQSKFSIPALDATANTRGVLLGVGLELDVGKGPWVAFVEMDRVAYGSKAVQGANFRPVDATALIGVRYKLGN